MEGFIGEDEYVGVLFVLMLDVMVGGEWIEGVFVGVWCWIVWVVLVGECVGWVGVVVVVEVVVGGEFCVEVCVWWWLVF